MPIANFSQARFAFTIVSLLSLCLICLAIIGGVNNFSAIPLMDMWVGLDQVFGILDGLWHVFWIQHHEHRLVLARLFFCIDVIFFDGKGIFLIVLNYVFTLSSAVLFYFILQERLRPSKNVFATKLLGLLIAGILFSWIQKENLTWTVQSQFYLAQLLPLASFFFLFKTHVTASFKRKSTKFFILACITGIGSVGSMANGTLTLPLMTVMAIVLGMNKIRISWLLILTVMVSWAYFGDYKPAAQHGSVKDTLLEQPVEMLRYVLLYLGGPMYHLTPFISDIVGLALAYLSGVLLLVLSVYFGFRALRDIKNSALQIALLTFLLYIVGSAFGTAGGRLPIFGLEQALSSRYMTPALMTWAAMIILLAPFIARRLQYHFTVSLSFIIVFQLLFLPSQLTALHSQETKLFEQRLDILAVKMGISNDEQVKWVYPKAKPILRIAKEAKKRGVSIFGDPLINDTSKNLGSKLLLNNETECIGHLQQNYQLFPQDGRVKISGWMADSTTSSVPKNIAILDEKSYIVGYAITGSPRPDANNEKLLKSGFVGFMQSNQLGKKLTLKGFNPDCLMKDKIVVSSDDLYFHNLSSLALELGINDDKQMNAFPVNKPIFVSKDNKASQPVSFRNVPIVNQAVKCLGKKEPTRAFNQCDGKVDRFDIIDSDFGYLKLKGTIRYSTTNKKPSILKMMGKDRRVAGLALLAKVPNRGASDDSLNPPKGHFVGYLRSDQIGYQINIHDWHNDCAFIAYVDNPLFSLKLVSALNQKNIAVTDMIKTNQWRNSDAQETKVKGFKATGSYGQIHDNDIVIELKMKRGDAIFYRSGSKVGKQLLIVEANGQSFRITLPVAENWVTLRFANENLPQSFVLKIIDAGNHKDEWSAIGLRDS